VQKLQIVNQYPEIYDPLERLPRHNQIKLWDNAKPLALQVPRKLPIGLREAYYIEDTKE